MDSGLLNSQPPLRPATTGPVRVWLLLSKYGGDNAQVRALGDHLARRFGWSCEDRQVRFLTAKKVVREKLPEGIYVAKSDSLAGPFPDVIISCSRFYGMVAAWLKQQSADSTGRPMVHVHIGRIAAPMASFDVLGATAQYGLPAAPNFIPLTLPFVPQELFRSETDISAWQTKIDDLPHTWTVILVC
jgi:hypothetical protein